jgi:hypothetical protein
MGYPYHELISPAILLDNPGITKEEFSSKLQATHYSTDEIDQSAPWDSSLPNTFAPPQLPEILGLSYTPGFTRFQQPRRDRNYLDINAPKMDTVFQQVDGHLTAVGYKVIRHIGNDLGEVESLDIYDYGKVQEGDVITDYLGDGGDFSVCSVTRDTAQVQRITPKINTQTYPSLEDLYQEWPQFKPENMFDFSQTHGTLDYTFGVEGFLWKKVDGKYYLDEETFNRISASFAAGDYINFGYTDLILTAEAIKHKAWKLLSRRGLDHLDDFFEAFPDSMVRYEKAVWDSHTSLAAKSKNMTITDFLRMRLTPFTIAEEVK